MHYCRIASKRHHSRPKCVSLSGGNRHLYLLWMVEENSKLFQIQEFQYMRAGPHSEKMSFKKSEFVNFIIVVMHKPLWSTRHNTRQGINFKMVHKGQKVQKGPYRVLKDVKGPLLVLQFRFFLVKMGRLDAKWSRNCHQIRALTSLVFNIYCLIMRGCYYCTEGTVDITVSYPIENLKSSMSVKKGPSIFLYCCGDWRSSSGLEMHYYVA